MKDKLPETEGKVILVKKWQKYLAELYSSVWWRVNFASNETGYLAEEYRSSGLGLSQV